MKYAIPMTAVLVAMLAPGFSAAAKKDAVAEAIAKARAGEPAETVVDESASLKELLSDAKLVARASEGGDAAQVAAAVMGPVSVDSSSSESSSKAGESATSDETLAEDKSAISSDEDVDVSAVGKTDVSKMAEKDIPIAAAKPKTAKSGASTLARVLASFGILLLLGLSVALGLKKYTRRAKGGNATTKIKILTQHHIGPKRSLAIVQVAGESILVGITDHSITMLKTLSLLDEEIPEATPRDFNAAMDDFEFDAEEEGRSPVQRPQDDFAMRGLSDIRDSVSRRLKGLRQI